MYRELIFDFPEPDRVNVAFDGADSGSLDFTSPVTESDRQDIRWYVETYGAHSLAEPDDNEAHRIKGRLREIGKALFNAVLRHQEAYELFIDFRRCPDTERVITIKSAHASVLSLPWELLHDPKDVYLFRDRPHISVRRTISGSTKGRRPFKVKPKDSIHLLFVVSRPSDAGFIDPRADPQAVLDAVDEYAPGRVVCEFLRPATLNALVNRLDDDTKPAIDILHFDGHGVFKQVSEDDIDEHNRVYSKCILSEIQRERASRREGNAGKPVGIGFLVFEDEHGKRQLVPANALGDNLFRSRVGLVVLSACQTASLEEEGDPMASVAGRLTWARIPAILAMTHSVLVATTRTLFGKFYESLARGRSIARSLDDARVYLANNPAKFEVQRGEKRAMLNLTDWFVPTLFHGGSSSAMLTESVDKGAERPMVRHNFRKPARAGFFGRRRELWDIERWFSGKARRISITGFGGQGKTELALEAGRWLLRTDMFEQAVFVDYASVQSADPVSVAVSTIGVTVEETLIDADAVARVLQHTATLVILDNLETLDDEPLQGLLCAASAWSQAGDSRVLLTSRKPQTGHPDFAIEGTYEHRRIVLTGLGSANAPDDALDWFSELDRLPSAETRQVPPPERDDLIRLFDRVRFHPLSICVLVQQLRSRTAKQLEARLEQLLSDDSTSLVAEVGTPDSLIASLQLSLERLSEKERHAVRRLGVFQGGAMEADLLVITELGESNHERDQLQSVLSAWDGGDPSLLLKMMGMELPDNADVPTELLQQLPTNPKIQQHIQQLRDQLATLPDSAEDNVWPELRRSLEVVALIQAESIPGVGPPFLRFHPTLAPMLWARLSTEERESLSLAHRQRYYAVANYLYQQDSKNPHQVRAIVRRELPNLLRAVHGALDAVDADAVDFVDSISLFLKFFGMSREAALLTRRAEQAGGKRGSENWYLAQSNRGEQWLSSGRADDAAQIFNDILESLGEAPSYKRATTLGSMGRCYESGGRPDLAEGMYRQGIAVTEQLDASDLVNRHRGAMQTDLANVLRRQGKYAEAREQYELGLEFKTEVADLRGQAVTLGQLGTLAMAEGDLADAVKRYYEALELFQRLGEPAMEAVAQHQLGMAFQEAEQWEQAEHHYRESARLEEQRGDLAAASLTWNCLATVAEAAGKPEAAETWYRKAIDGVQAVNGFVTLSFCLNNLADLLQRQPGRLDEARKLAEESLAIKQTLDPGAAEIWSTYCILADIAEQQNRPHEVIKYRRKAREAKRNFAGTRHELRRHIELIEAVVNACGGDENSCKLVTAHTDAMKNGGDKWTECAESIDQIITGERNEKTLVGTLDLMQSMIIETILAAIEDPAILEDLLPQDHDDDDGDRE